MSTLLKTVHSDDLISIGDLRPFRLYRCGTHQGVRRIDMLTNQPGTFLLSSLALLEGMRTEVAPDVFVTVTDASKQSRFHVTIEAPTEIKIDVAKGHRNAKVTLVKSKILRFVELPLDGGLYLFRMPGRHEPLQTVLDEIERVGIDYIVCLAPIEEIRRKSTEYAEALENGFPLQVDFLPVEDFGVPSDVDTLWEHAKMTRDALLGGDRVLVHCAGGIGRTGMYATAVAITLGLSYEEAIRRVRDAGSAPETPKQRALLRNGCFQLN